MTKAEYATYPDASEVREVRAIQIVSHFPLTASIPIAVGKTTVT